MFQLSSLTRKGAGCRDLLNCAFGLKDFEQELFYMLSGGTGGTLDSIAAETGRDRSTIHRALSKLNGAGLCYRRVVNLRGGGYLHMYYASDAETVTAGIRARVDEIKESLDRLADGFGAELSDNILRSANHKNRD